MASLLGTIHSCLARLSCFQRRAVPQDANRALAVSEALRLLLNPENDSMRQTETQRRIDDIYLPIFTLVEILLEKSVERPIVIGISAPQVSC